jgi:ATP-binding cassette subfamily C protein
LLLLVPLLQLAGVSHPSGALFKAARAVYGALGLSLTLRNLLVTYVVIVAMAAGLNAYQNVVLNRYRLEFVDSVRRRLFRSVGRAKWSHLLGLRNSDLLSALNVESNWIGQATMATLNLGAAIVLMAVQIAVVVELSPAVTALAVVTSAFLVAVVWPLVARSRRLGRDLVGHNRGVGASIVGFLDGLKLAKAHGLEAGHFAGFDDSIARSRQTQIEFVKAQSAAMAVQLTITGVVLAILIGVAVEQFHVAIARVLVMALVFTRLVPQVAQFQQNIQTLAQCLPAFGGVSRLIDDCERAEEHLGGEKNPHPHMRQERMTLEESLVFDDVCFSHHRPDGQSVAVLHNVSLVLPARTTTALVGASGAGKTTIADLVVGLLTPTMGVVTVDGVPLHGERIPRWRESVAMVPQDSFLFHETIRANLAWANREAEEAEMWSALEMASAKEFVTGLPQGLDTVVGDRGGNLSGGERQRVALARALLRQPRLLVLDEATNSLDPVNESAILDALAALHGRTTILVIAHQASMLRDADQVLTVNGGRICAHSARGHTFPMGT